MSLAAKLKRLRLKSGNSLQVVADAVGVSKAHFWELETGKSKNPSADLLEKIAGYFKVSVASLVGEDPESDENEWAVAMFRNLKNVDDKDRKIIETILDQYRKGRKGGDKG